MFSSGPHYTKLKTNLRLAINRLKMLQKKKTESNLKARREIADYLSAAKTDRARIRVESIIREDFLVEALELIEMYADLCLARFGLIETQKEMDPGLEEAISTLIWSAPRLSTDVQELRVIAEQFAYKYGKEFARECTMAQPINTTAQNMNTLLIADMVAPLDPTRPIAPGMGSPALGASIRPAALPQENSAKVSPKVMSKMSVQAPARHLVERYLDEIARAYNVAFNPDPNIMAEYNASAANRLLLDLASVPSANPGSVVPPAPSNEHGLLQAPQYGAVAPPLPSSAPVGMVPPQGQFGMPGGPPGQVPPWFGNNMFNPAAPTGSYSEGMETKPPLFNPNDASSPGPGAGPGPAFGGQFSGGASGFSAPPGSASQQHQFGMSGPGPSPGNPVIGFNMGPGQTPPPGPGPNPDARFMPSQGPGNPGPSNWNLNPNMAPPMGPPRPEQFGGPPSYNSSVGADSVGMGGPGMGGPGIGSPPYMGQPRGFHGLPPPAGGPGAGAGLGPGAGMGGLNLPEVPNQGELSGDGGAIRDVDFDDLARRFEELKRKK